MNSWGGCLTQQRALALELSEYIETIHFFHFCNFLVLLTGCVTSGLFQHN